MQLDLNALNPHPGFASTIFISWDDIAEYFSLFEYWPLLREGEEPSEDLVNFAFEEARKWAQAQAKQQSLPPTDNQIIKAETSIIESLKRHWSAAKALDGIFDFATCAKLTNDWSHNGAKRPELFGVTPDPGKSIDYILSNLGVSFTVYPPFIIPYTEIYYRLNDNLPEWDYEDLNGTDILETIIALYEEKIEEVSIDLTGRLGELV
jgi:hypothetical protein